MLLFFILQQQRILLFLTVVSSLFVVVVVSASAVVSVEASSISNLEQYDHVQSPPPHPTIQQSQIQQSQIQQQYHHHHHHHRIIQQQQQQPIQRDFVPLSCNANLATTPCSTTWSSSLFGNNGTTTTSTTSTSTSTTISYNERITIPCGQCIVMDVVSSNTAATDTTTTIYEFLQGIDIIGKLVIDVTSATSTNAILLHIRTTMMVVQGELHIIANTKPVNGIPNVLITMISTSTSSNTNTNTFIPINENAYACKGIETCTIGPKAIVVAGGSIRMNGIPNDTTSWTYIYNVTGGTNSNAPTTLILPAVGIYNKWNIGAELVITSHTTIWNATQVRTIRSIQLLVSTDTNYVSIQLNTSIRRPTTILESIDFATEVALLSRNIVFDGGSIETIDQGGHFMIMNTPNVIQSIIGVDIQRFGQQGILGRYPIHFHYCNNTQQSIVSKNTIRQSFQRCIVIHGTNYVLIDNNVAYDTKGHCYITEDGIEQYNIFQYNIGIQTSIPNIIIPNMGTNGIESDHEPSTFWITAPLNTFSNNVAAGSQHSGYWFEPKLRGERITSVYSGYNPQNTPIILFHNNVAHSTTGRNSGAIRMYEPGYRPYTMTNLTGLKVFRNYAIGIDIHRCQNIRIDQGLFADNYIGIDLDRTEGIEVTNTIVIGQSASYEALQRRQTGVLSICDANQRIGIDLHTWQVETDYYHGKLSNVTIMNFTNNDPRCGKVRSIRFDSFNLKQGLFESYAGFEKTTLSEGVNSIDMCVINNTVHDFVYIIDLDGSFRPTTITTTSSTTTTTGIATLVASDNKKHMTFVDATKCSDNPIGCYSYCSDTCFRSMRYYVDGIGQANYTLQICSSTNTAMCSQFKGGRRGSTGSHEFIAHLPSGQQYTAQFLDAINFSIVRPTRIRPLIEKHFCPTDSIFVVTLIQPPPIAVPVSVPVSSPISIPTTISPSDYDGTGAPILTAPVSTPVSVPTPVRLPVGTITANPYPVPVTGTLSPLSLPQSPISIGTTTKAPGVTPITSPATTTQAPQPTMTITLIPIRGDKIPTSVPITTTTTTGSPIIVTVPPTTPPPVSHQLTLLQRIWNTIWNMIQNLFSILVTRFQIIFE